MSDNKSFKVQNGLDVTGDANVSGSVTATSFIGDGSQLTGISEVVVAVADPLRF